MPAPAFIGLALVLTAPVPAWADPAAAGRAPRAVVGLVEPRAVRLAPDRRSLRATMTGYDG